MSVDTLRLLEHVHALLAWVGTLGLVLAAWLFLRSSASTRTRAVGATAVALLAVAAMIGLALQAPYRRLVRQRLFVMSPSLGWLFERKQHAAFGALLLGVSALASLLLCARRLPGARSYRRSSAVAWTASAALALFASIASAIVAGRAHF